jgi:hypothetical protein
MYDVRILCSSYTNILSFSHWLLTLLSVIFHLFDYIFCLVGLFVDKLLPLNHAQQYNKLY